MNVEGVSVTLADLILAEASPVNKLFNDPKFAKIKDCLDTKCEGYTTDFGKLCSKDPEAVFKPKTESDLELFITLANLHKVSVTVRAQGHSMNGQTLSDTGIVIDLSNLPKDPKISHKTLSIAAHATWKEVTDFTLQHGFTVPVVTDYLGLSVGATIGFGGLGGSSFKMGSQADHIERFRILTFKGEILECSTRENQELYEVALCGLGQMGIILEVGLSLVSAKQFVQEYECSYSDPEAFLLAQRELYNAGNVDHLKGHVKKVDGQWVYVVKAATFVDEPQEQTCGYGAFINEVDVFIEALDKAGKLDVPHPWYTVLIPEDKILDHLKAALASPFLQGEEPILVYPLSNAAFCCQNFVKPKNTTFYSLSVLYNCSFSARSDIAVDQLLAFSREQYNRLKNDGGCRYPVDATTFDQADWQAHFGPRWQHFAAMKQLYDPNSLKSLV